MYFTHSLKPKEDKMNTLTSTVARILYAVPFLIFGLNHFMNANMLKGMVPSFVPIPIFWVYLIGLALIAAAVSILTKKYTRLACLSLAALLMVFVLTMHIPGLMDEKTMMLSMMNMLKDTALSGAALMFAGRSDG